ncbi:MAG: alpha/beta hydrolase [Halieaceae bacterium]|jgi:acetyl esterase/lipase|nr:alpha/beta hydrolase [Halieaceae bacterium]
MYWSVGLVLLAGFLLLVYLRFLRGTNLAVYDRPWPDIVGEGASPSEAHFAMVEELAHKAAGVTSASGRSRLVLMRETMDNMGKDVDFAGRYLPVDAGSVRGEWVMAPGVDASRRMLYIHGGAFLAGSPLSHRAITTELSRRLGGAVFSLDYRLMPEHPRSAGIEDCREAYRWIRTHGPECEGDADVLFVAGDSAGGNLALALAIWVRDARLTAPNGVIALCPATDSTFSSPSLASNVTTDHMLGPLFGKLNQIPGPLLALSSWFTNRRPPTDPQVSPVFADLSGLPPLLVQASAQEMLRDDAVRFVNRARAFGSPAELQLFANMLHVWHIFVQRGVEEAQQAFDEIALFMSACCEQGAEAAA